MDTSFNISSISDVCLLTSTPKTSRSRPRARAPFKSPGKARAPAPRKNPICGLCDICGKEYVRRKSLDEHLRMHFLQDSSSQYPNEEKLVLETPTIAQSCLQKMVLSESVGLYGAEHNSFIQCLLNNHDQHWANTAFAVSQHFIRSLVKGKFLLPSALLPTVLKVCDKLLTDRDFRENEMMKNLRNVGGDDENWSEPMLHCFVCEFIHKFGEEIIVFICFFVVGTKVRKQPVIPLQLDIEDRQVIFNVAGSVMRGFVNMGERYKKNRDWISIVRAIKTRVAEGDGRTGVARAPESDRAWTNTLNRKSLIFIGAPAMDFFVSLTHLLYNVECSEAGNFHVMNVIKSVYEDSVTVLLWDEVIGTSLDTRLSTKFLQGVVKSFSQTYAKGVANKKLNTHLKKAFVAINLRHSIAPRQTG